MLKMPQRLLGRPEFCLWWFSLPPGEVPGMAPRRRILRLSPAACRKLACLVIFLRSPLDSRSIFFWDVFQFITFCSLCFCRLVLRGATLKCLLVFTGLTLSHCLGFLGVVLSHCLGFWGVVLSHCLLESAEWKTVGNPSSVSWRAIWGTILNVSSSEDRWPMVDAAELGTTLRFISSVGVTAELIIFAFLTWPRKLWTLILTSRIWPSKHARLVWFLFNKFQMLLKVDPVNSLVILRSKCLARILRLYSIVKLLSANLRFWNSLVTWDGLRLGSTSRQVRGVRLAFKGGLCSGFWDINQKKTVSLEVLQLWSRGTTRLRLKWERDPVKQKGEIPIANKYQFVSPARWSKKMLQNDYPDRMLILSGMYPGSTLNGAMKMLIAFALLGFWATV